ncbi:hypothetical protein [Sagittula sp. S175]|uniref:hypothetical protein n=1 Tax=Sagittula sp. S175 TaxID=3415129 RepID=UPI003C7BF6A2
MKNTAGLLRKTPTARRDALVKQRELPQITSADLLKLVLILAVAASLAGCGRLGKGAREQVQTFDGQVFRGSAKALDDGPAHFVASVREPAKSIDGAVQAATYQATKYCIETYGTSDIDWEVGPDTPKDQLAVTSESLSLTGRCRDL